MSDSEIPPFAPPNEDNKDKSNIKSASDESMGTSESCSNLQSQSSALTSPTKEETSIDRCPNLMALLSSPHKRHKEASYDDFSPSKRLCYDPLQAGPSQQLHFDSSVEPKYKNFQVRSNVILESESSLESSTTSDELPELEVTSSHSAVTSTKRKKKREMEVDESEHVSTTKRTSSDSSQSSRPGSDLVESNQIDEDASEPSSATALAQAVSSTSTPHETSSNPNIAHQSEPGSPEARPDSFANVAEHLQWSNIPNVETNDSDVESDHEMVSSVVEKVPMELDEQLAENNEAEAAS